MFDSICIIWLYPIKMIERDSVWLDLIPSFQYSTWLKMQNIVHPNSLSLQLLKRNGTSYGGAGSPHQHIIEPSLWTAHKTKNTVREDLGLVMLDSIKTSCIREFSEASFLSAATSSHFFAKNTSIWMQREGPTVQESCKINMNVGLAPHLATSKLKILRGLCQGSRGSIHDPQLFQIWVSSTVNPIHQKASVSS